MARRGRDHRPRKFHKKRKKYPITPSKDEDDPVKSLGWKEDCLPYIKEHWRGKKNPSVKKIEIIGDTPGSSSIMGEMILEECSVLTEIKFVIYNKGFFFGTLLIFLNSQNPIRHQQNDLLEIKFGH